MGTDILRPRTERRSVSTKHDQSPTMRAAVHRRYGPPEVLAIERIPRPSVGRGDVLVRVEATSVTAADWRIRGSSFPPSFFAVGRVMFGLRRPRRIVTGREFAGTVVGTGGDVRGFRLGQRVFGIANGGAAAELLGVPWFGPLAPIPEGLDTEKAAPLPFGAMCALAFLRDIARVRGGESVAILGASGGVGVYAVQIGRALGATVTGFCGRRNMAMVIELGASAAHDYRTTTLSRTGERFDVILDTVGAISFAEARSSLAPNGRFVPLEFGVREVFQAFTTGWQNGPRVITAVSGDNRSLLDDVVRLVETGRLRPIIGRRYPLTNIARAHAYVEGRHRTGSTVVQVR